jgi:hypothetical protein
VLSPSAKTSPTGKPASDCLEIILEAIAFDDIPGLRGAPTIISGGGSGSIGGSGSLNKDKIIFIIPERKHLKIL